MGSDHVGAGTDLEELVVEDEHRHGDGGDDDAGDVRLVDPVEHLDDGLW